MQEVSYNADIIKDLKQSATDELQNLRQRLSDVINGYKNTWHYRYRTRVWENDNSQAKHPRLVDVEQLENIVQNTPLSSTLLQALEAYLNHPEHFYFAKLSPLRTRLNQASKNYRATHNIKLIDKHLQLMDVKEKALDEMHSDDTERVVSESYSEIKELQAELTRVHEQHDEKQVQIDQMRLTSADMQTAIIKQQNEMKILEEQIAAAKLSLSQMISADQLADKERQFTQLTEELHTEKQRTQSLQQELVNSQNALRMAQQSLAEHTATLEEFGKIRSQLVEATQQNLSMQLTISELNTKLDQTTLMLQTAQQTLQEQSQSLAASEEKWQTVEKLQENLQRTVDDLQRSNQDLHGHIKTKDAMIHQQAQFIDDHHEKLVFFTHTFASYKDSTTELINAFTQILSQVVLLFKQTLHPQSGKKLRNEIRSQLQTNSGKYAGLLLQQVDEEKKISMETSYKKYIRDEDVVQQLLDAESSPATLTIVANSDSVSTPQTPAKGLRVSLESAPLGAHPDSLVAKIGERTPSAPATPENRLRLQKGQKLNPAFIGKPSLTAEAIEAEYSNRYSSRINHL